MIPLDEAQAELVAACPRQEAVVRPVRLALGCVCAEDIVAPYAVPPFENSSVDGYAVRAADVAAATDDHPVTLSVLGAVHAGSVATRPVLGGQAWKVMTGAALPPGTDAVVMVENTSAHAGRLTATLGESVLVYRGGPAGAGVRQAGSDVAAGEVVIEAGTQLEAAHLGVLASVGLRSVRVYPRLRVGVLVTGDELVTETRPLGPGEIYESNSAMIAALLQQSNCVPIELGVADDDPEALAARMVAAASECDAIVTTGGVSMGDADPVKAALASMGRLHWLQVSIRPAKPFAYALLDGPRGPIPLFGLPGNPVSSLVSFELLARPALRAMAGHSALHRVQVVAIADAPLTSTGTDGRTTHLRVRMAFAPDGRLHVRPVAAQDSHQLAQTARADGLAELPPGCTVEPGGEVLVRALRWDP